MKTKNEYNKLTEKIIGIAIDIHKCLGPGFIERIYEKAFAFELEKRKVNFENQKVIQINYKETKLGSQRIDFLIEDEIIIELKAVSGLNDIHLAQMLSYLKTIDKRVGLILNFAKPKLEIKRVVNDF